MTKKTIKGAVFRPTTMSIAMFNAGIIQQVAPPAELYESPANSFVAQFIGENNRLPGRIEDHRIAAGGEKPARREGGIACALGRKLRGGRLLRRAGRCAGPAVRFAERLLCLRAADGCHGQRQRRTGAQSCHCHDLLCPLFSRLKQCPQRGAVSSGWAAAIPTFNHSYSRTFAKKD